MIGLKNGRISAFSTSPSGQIVAHVAMDNGRTFTIPFGKDVTPAQIVKAAQDEIDRHIEVITHARNLRQAMGLEAIEPAVLRAPIPVLPVLMPKKLGLLDRIKLFFLKLFRRHK